MGLYIGQLAISSAAFEHLGVIPDRYTGVGDGVAPPLTWSGAPDGTRSLAVICHDADAPLPHGWTHWIVVGIPPDADRIPEGGRAFVEATNDFGDLGYGPPMPPEGHGCHHYYFWVYALGADVDADPTLTRAQFLERWGDQVIEQARTVGTVDR